MIKNCCSKVTSIMTPANTTSATSNLSITNSTQLLQSSLPAQASSQQQQQQAQQEHHQVTEEKQQSQQQQHTEHHHRSSTLSESSECKNADARKVLCTLNCKEQPQLFCQEHQIDSLSPSDNTSSGDVSLTAVNVVQDSTITNLASQAQFTDDCSKTSNNNCSHPQPFGTVRPNLDLTKLYRKSSAIIVESSFYTSESSSSNSISAMLSPELVTNLTLLDHKDPELIENLHKISIHHQDAEVSIADATDCLRQVGGKIDWYHRKQVFCPHLMTPTDAIQIAGMHQKILYEEIPFLELKNRLKEDTDCDFPRELEGRFLHVCGLFIELKNRIQDLINSLSDDLLIAAGQP